MFCTNCGETISDDAKFCPQCGEDLEEVIDILKETSSTSDFSSAESDLKLSLEGEVKTVYASATKSNEFKIIIHNTSPNSITNVEVQLTGSDLVEVISGYEYYYIIGSGQKVSATFIIHPKYTGTFTLTAIIQSSRYTSVGHSLTFPIEVRVMTAKDPRMPAKNVKGSRIPITSSRPPITSSRPPLRANQTLAVLIVVALVGLLLMIWGITSFFRPSGLEFNGSITVLVIGFILLAIGTKGQCCILPFACACDGCGDCDCDC